MNPAIPRLPALWPACAIASVLCRMAAAAQDPAATDDFERPQHQWQIGARVGLHLSVDFATRAPALIASLPDLAASSFTRRQYVDGFIAPDDSGSMDGDTWNWGYERGTQIAADGSTLNLHAYEGSPFGDAGDRTDDPHWGGEIRYLWTAREWAGATWGLDAGLQWTSLAVKDRGAYAGTIQEVTDAYDLLGILPPSAPYTGSATGPGPLINASSAVRSARAVPTLVTGSREFSADLIGFQVGPRLDIPLGEWLSASLGGGLAWGYLDGEIRYDEQAAVVGGPVWSRRGHAADTDWLVGGYLRGQLNIRLTDRWGLYGGAEFQGLTSTSIADTDVEARVGFGAGYSFSAGVQFRF